MSGRAEDVGALDRLLEVTVLLGQDMAEGLAVHGLTVARTTLLWQLRGSGPSTQRALADALGVSPRNVTGLVDGLVAGGLVTREPHPTDRRATLVSFTDRGARLVDELAAGQAELAGQLFGGLSRRPARVPGGGPGRRARAAAGPGRGARRRERRPPPRPPSRRLRARDVAGASPAGCSGGPTSRAGADAFPYAGDVTPVLWAFIVVSAIEVPVVHLLVPWESLRLALDVAGVYGVLWMVGPAGLAADGAAHRGRRRPAGALRCVARPVRALGGHRRGAGPPPVGGGVPHGAPAPGRPPAGRLGERRAPPRRSTSSCGRRACCRCGGRGRSRWASSGSPPTTPPPSRDGCAPGWRPRRRASVGVCACRSSGPGSTSSSARCGPRA